MTIDIHDLALIEAIDRTGSFSGAAEEFFRTRSAVTQRVQKIEAQLRFQIFDRSTYRPSLTPEGRLFLEKGRPFLRNFKRFQSEVQHIQQGWESEFSIALDDLIPIENLYTLIKDFRKVAPQVNLRLHREVLNGCWDSLMTHRADLVIGAWGEPPLELTCNDMSLGTIEFAFVVAANHPLAQLERIVTPEDLVTYPMISVSDTSISLPQKTTGVVSQQPKITVPTMDAKVQAHVQGLGVGYLPLLRAKSLIDQGQLVELPLTHTVKNRTDYKIAWHKESSGPSLEWFLEALERKTNKDKILGIP